MQKLISGGQTGVDRAALDAALAFDFPCGGYCPKGRVAQDGTIPLRYPLDELGQKGYRQRTLRNVEGADATLVIYFGEVTGGTGLTVSACLKRHTPFKLVDGEVQTAEAAAQRVREFCLKHRVVTLNVAGPSARRAPRAYDYTYELVQRLLKSVREE